MSEYHKMISGELYDANDQELVRMRLGARELLSRINSSMNDIKDGPRLELCRALFGRLGATFWLQPPFYCDYGKNIEIGDNVFFNFNCVILDVAKVTIGSHVMFGPNVQVYTAGHPKSADERQQGLEFGKSIIISDHVWIGGSAVLCPGVSVGKNSIVAAGSVVTKDVPPDVMVGGNPARIIQAV